MKDWIKIPRTKGDIRRDYKKVRRVNSAIILNLLNNISEERKTEIRNKMIDELNNEE